MINLQTKDGNKKSRNLTINGFIKPSGTIVASVKNDKGDTYFVQIRKDGTSVCEHMVDDKREECQGHHFTGHCYHVDAVRAQVFESYEQITTFSVAEVMDDADTAMRMSENENPYDVLAPTKSVSSDWQQYRYYEMGLGINY